MQDVAYNTTIMHLRLSDVHDIDSYITLMRYAWMSYQMEILAALFIGCVGGILITKHIYNSEVLHKWIQNQIQKSKLRQ